VYKIRDKETGLFSKGGSHPRWSAKGKTWQSKGALSGHLALANGRFYEEAEIVEIQCVESGIISLGDWRAVVAERRSKRIRAAAYRRECYIIEQRRKQYLTLKEEFEGK
jgi:hypothetical protein